MALLTYPLVLSDFMEKLQIERIRFRLNKRMNFSGIGTGRILAAEIGPDFWSLEIVLRTLYSQESREVQGLLDALDGGLNDFYAYDKIFAYPQSDPDGTILGGATITNTAVHGSGEAMKFDGFPDPPGPGLYQLNTGDMFGFSYGPGGIYKALHRITSGGTANSDWISFKPALADPDLATGKNMDFKKAVGRFKLVPDSLDYGEAMDIHTSGITLSAEQVP